MKTLYEKIREKHGKPKPILFNTEMVRAIIDGQKTQTRRPIQAPGNEYHYEKLLCDLGLSCKLEIIEDELHWELQTAVDDSGTYTEKLLHQPGDILYVRETFADISETEPGNIHYKASANEEDLEWFNENGWNWRPSIHMPKRIARLFLKVTDVRVERLHETTGVDVVREGFKEPQNFIKDWNEIYKEKGYGWDEDPWVWVIEFEVSEIEK